MTQVLAPRFGKYEVVDKIGEGGEAEVYRAKHVSTGELVAVKAALPGVANDAIHRQRFEQEYRVASRLRHPAIVRALEFGEAEGRPFIVLEYVDGIDLWDYIVERGRLRSEEAVRLITQVAEGLHEAHQKGIIHRDVKPNNILITPTGLAKLADLGLVKDLDADLDLTRTRSGLGTPNFMAPEQFGDAKRVGVPSDVYSMGGTLYMAVTGEMPFTGKAVGIILKKKLANDLKPPKELVRSIPAHLDLAIRRSLRADPHQRQSSCLEFIQTLSLSTVHVRQEQKRPAKGPGLDAFFPQAPQVENRAWVRYPCHKETKCDIQVSIHHEEIEAKDTWPATLQDLSVKGVGLLMQRRFELKTMLSLLLESRNRSVSRNLEMQVVRVQKSRDGKGWLLGARFLTPLTKEELQRLL